ncbi:SET domain-containing protein [Variovorax sp. RB3P1]|uniref:SET domain-containing protein n=1 Tax=Variovorax sp. RB3P1 TaxID=3443732 RepID=UPI003F47A75C
MKSSLPTHSMPCSMSVEVCPLIEIRTSAVHGLGAFAIRDISPGTCVGIYAGRRFSETQLLDEDWTDWDSGQTYLFALSDGTTIDGAQGGNATRYLNHACSPNCLAVEELDPTERITLRIVAIEAVPKWAELLLDYSLIIDPGEKASDYPCQCGASSCRGSMAALRTPAQAKNLRGSRRP